MMTRGIRFFAALILAAGAGWAAYLYTASPGVSSPDLSGLREAAVRAAALEAQPARTLPALPARRHGRPARTAVADPPSGAPIARAARPSGIRGASPAPAPEGPGAAAPDTAPALNDVVENLALLGVTYCNETDQAWLVDLTDRERQIAAEGETAFGLTVREIRPESVILAKGGDRFELYLGQKPIPPTPLSEPPDGTPAGEPQPPPSNSTGRSSRASSIRARYYRPSRRTAPYGATSRTARAGSSERESRRRDDRERQRFSRDLSLATTLSRAARSQRPGRSASAFAPPLASGPPTSNPQTARRRGARLVGDAEPLPEPEEVRNPQTLRRRGGLQGATFGDAGPRGQERGRG